ncbi:hypothetical protein ABTN45_19345, partial [Acinetobacter baumannii]
QELLSRCPVVYVECVGKRQFANTSNVDGKCRIQIMDNETLSRLAPASVFDIEWEEVADAMNHGRLIHLAVVIEKKHEAPR